MLVGIIQVRSLTLLHTVVIGKCRNILKRSYLLSREASSLRWRLPIWAKKFYCSSITYGGWFVPFYKLSLHYFKAKIRQNDNYCGDCSPQNNKKMTGWQNAKSKRQNWDDKFNKQQIHTNIPIFRKKRSNLLSFHYFWAKRRQTKN